MAGVLERIAHELQSRKAQADILCENFPARHAPALPCGYPAYAFVMVSVIRASESGPSKGGVSYLLLPVCRTCLSARPGPTRTASLTKGRDLWAVQRVLLD